MKIDKYVKDLYNRLDSTFPVVAATDSNCNNSNNRILVGVDKHDDEYYMDILDTTPNRFVLYRHARWEKLNDRGRLTCEGVDDTITQDELDYYLKWRLRDSPEQRYQDAKHGHVFHGKEGLFHHGYGDGRDGWCNPECKYYPEYGRIEDEEIIADHKEAEEYYRKRNAIVEPPSETEMLRLAEKLFSEDGHLK